MPAPPARHDIPLDFDDPRVRRGLELAGLGESPLAAADKQTLRDLYIHHDPASVAKALAFLKTFPRFLDTGRAVPCPFNVDGIVEADVVLICDGESDTMTALSHGYAAVGIPGWAAFEPESEGRPGRERLKSGRSRFKFHGETDDR